MLSSCFYPFGEKMKFSFMVRACFAELIGTMILVTVATSLKTNAVAGALALSYAIWLAGPISGGHVNPIVSFLMLLQKKLGFFVFLFYVLAQLIGATLGCIVGKSLLIVDHETAGMTILQADCTIEQAFWSETAFATFFALVVLSATNGERRSDSAFYTGVPGITPAVIGLATHIVGGIAGDLAGGSVNPARSLGPALANRNFENQWIYLVAPFLGAIIAVITYTFILDETMTLRRIKEFFGAKTSSRGSSQNDENEQKL